MPVESAVVRRLLVVSFGLAALLSASGAGAAAGGSQIDVVKVEGVIDPALSAYVRGAVESAARDSSIVVLQLDSRGSYGDEAMKLAAFIRDSGVPVVTWIGPVGSRLEGGALFLAYASSLVAMAPGAGIGPARPFDLATKREAEDPAKVARLETRLLAMAAESGPSPAGVRRLLTGRSLAAGPALSAGAVSVTASNAVDLIAKLDGRTVQTVRGPVVLSTLGAQHATIHFHEPGLLSRVVHAAATPTAVYVLLVLGLWGIAFELTQPGIGAAGVAGVLAVAFGAYELAIVSVSWVGLGILLIGIALQGGDVLIRRVGILTALGTAAFAAGSALAWRRVAPAIDLAWWLIALLTLGGVLLFGFGLTVALRSRERIRNVQMGLVGLVGEVRSDLDPEGGVHVKGALWRARSMNGPIPRGRRVRVRGIDGLVLRVQEEPD